MITICLLIKYKNPKYQMIFDTRMTTFIKVLIVLHCRVSTNLHLYQLTYLSIHLSHILSIYNPEIRLPIQLSILSCMLCMYKTCKSICLHSALSMQNKFGVMSNIRSKILVC